MNVIVSDIDGTILKDNQPIPHMVEMLKIDQQKYLLVFLTAREQRQSDSTFKTLLDLFDGGFRLICVGIKDSREKKINELRQLSSVCNICAYIDDDKAMINRVNQMGIPTVHVENN